MTQTQSTNTVIIGAGPAGLAMAACLSKENTPYIIIEQTDKVGVKWHNHYKRLHLHTAKAFSNLPYYNFPKQFPRYPARQQVVRYLEDYANHFDINPVFNTTVTNTRKQENGWKVEAVQDGQNITFDCKNLVVATGVNHIPKYPKWQGLEDFEGEFVHSDDYEDGSAYKDKTVMVVGFGNSGSEIVIDLWEYGAKPIMSVRSPVNILPKEVMGVPTLAMGILQQYLPVKLSDAMTKITAKTMIGDLSKYGLKPLNRGPMEEIYKNKRVPMLDIGTVDLIKQGNVVVYPDIERFTKDSVVFTDGREVKVDAVVSATGFTPQITNFVPQEQCFTDGFPNTSGTKSEIDGLYFIGFYVSPAGMFREMAKEAKKLAKIIK